MAKGQVEGGKALQAARAAEKDAASHRPTAAQKQQQIAELEVPSKQGRTQTKANTRRTHKVYCEHSVTLQQCERVIARNNNLGALVNTDPAEPIHTASATGRITCQRGRSP